MWNELILTPRASLEEARELLAGLRKKGIVFGTDEAGRGALAGPVLAASVYLTEEQEDKLLSMGLRDSKKISAKKRVKLVEAMQEMDVKYAVSSGSIDRIEKDNILVASLWTMGKSAKKLASELGQDPICVIVDGTERIEKLKYPQWTLIRADTLIPSVSAASVLAKVLRDQLMTRYSMKYPLYDFAQNKGYPTQAHMDMIAQAGMCAIHRPYFCEKIIALNRGSNAVN